MDSQAPMNHSDYGNVLIPTKLDQLARETPNHVFAAIPKSADFADGLEDITVSTLARAVDRIAWWLESIIGKTTEFETIAYLGPGLYYLRRIIFCHTTFAKILRQPISVTLFLQSLLLK